MDANKERQHYIRCYPVPRPAMSRELRRADPSTKICYGGFPPSFFTFHKPSLLFPLNRPIEILQKHSSIVLVDYLKKGITTLRKNYRSWFLIPLCGG